MFQHKHRLTAILTLPGMVLCLVALLGTAHAQTLLHFDFTRAGDRLAWSPAHDIARLEETPQGVRIVIQGDDPYMIGPARDLPAQQPLWLTIRLRSDQGGMGQIFYFTAQKGANETDSIRFSVPPGRWIERRVPMPALGPGTFLRFDPPGDGETCLLSSLTITPRLPLQTPTWPRLIPPSFQAAQSVRSGALELHQASDIWGGFEVQVAGQPMAIGYDRPLIGYLHGKGIRWLDVARQGKTTVRAHGSACMVETRLRDPDGAQWYLEMEFTPQSTGIGIVSRISTTQTRKVVFLPMLLLLPGADYPNQRHPGFGTTKNQAIFAGLEYLDKDEPSSSEADLIGPESRRQVPDSKKITFPLMAIQARDRYLGLIWQPQPQLSALFDSPDRLFSFGGHAMGLLYPGSNGSNREEGSLLPYDGTRLPAHSVITLQATLIGGKGNSVIPAVQQAVALLHVKETVVPRGDKHAYLMQATSGWLDSKIHERDRFRHAYPGSFTPQPAADAALWLQYIALQQGGQKLQTAAQAALAQVPPRDYNFAGIGHVRYPVESLVFGHTAENAERALQEGRGLLSRFEPDGSILYHKPADGPDLGKTHFAPDANGLTAQVVTTLLEHAAFCGDPDLIHQGLSHLRALDKFRNTVPRGAQTWEVPLHTPDILAAGYLVRAYTLGYALTGDAHLLAQAKYWAWTGVPFVYLTPPASQSIGLYGTIAVLGATQWVAPVWMGRPVQWCGLVYADALYRLLPYDAEGPWRILADGITLSGIQQSWPRQPDTARQGLLPDSFSPEDQMRNDPAINPGTLLPEAVPFFHLPAIYGFHVFRSHGLLVHAPGALTDCRETPGHISFTVQGWYDKPYEVLLAGLKSAPTVHINGIETPLTAPQQYEPSTGRLVLRVQGHPNIEVIPH